MSARVIINADDFGLSPAVNRGIVRALTEGVLTSTTMLTNLAAFEDAVGLTREHPGLPVGIHLSLLWGRPLSDPRDVPTLVERDGSLPRSLTTLAARYFTGRLAKDEVQRELRSQIRRFLDAGLTPTHVDTHKHVHSLPGVLDAVLEVAREHGIERIRLPVEQPLELGDRPSVPLAATAKRRLIGLLCRRARDRISRAGLRTTDHFLGIEQQHCLNSDLLRSILSNLRSGVTEIMCHPGYLDDEARTYSRTPPHREVELAGLMDARVKECIASAGVRLIHYGEL